MALAMIHFERGGGEDMICAFSQAWGESQVIKSRINSSFVQAQRFTIRRKDYPYSTNSHRPPAVDERNSLLILPAHRQNI